jgi:hypothetical protein
MRLFKKISYDRFLNLEEKNVFIKCLEEVLKEKKNNKISKIDIKDFNFYIVLDYINIFDTIDYDKIFPYQGVMIDYNSLQKEHNSIINKIKKRFEKNNEPNIFNKLGVTNFVKGCFLIGGNIKEIPKSINRSSGSFVSIKLDYKNLPKEINELCEEYYNKQNFYISKEQEEFEHFFKLTSKEQEKLMGNFFEQFSSSTNKTILFSFTGVNIANNAEPITFEDFFSHNLDFFSDKEFLETMMKKAMNEEKYEICAKIKKRLDNLLNK